MITKLAKFKNSWVIKILLTITALSFVSLFGITGYIGSAGKNKPIVRVGSTRVTQTEITNQYNRELQMAKNLFGDNLSINDAMRTAILQGIIQKELVTSIMKETSDDLGVYISDEYARKIIFSQAEFLDANGKFSHDKFKRLISASGWNEAKYIQAVKQDVIKQHLVQNVVDNFNIPKFMTPYFENINNQEKIFKYININQDKLQIDRKISTEELEQYYQDFAPQFIEPESRDISFIVLSTDDIAAKIKPSDEDIKTYYDENITQYVTPEKRNVLQMVFDTKENADTAYAKLKSGQDFYAVAAETAKQDKAATDLGWVSKDMLIADMGDGVFALAKGGFTVPVKSEMGWHIMKMVGSEPKIETPLITAKNGIVAAIQREQAYDQAAEIITSIEDQIGAGKSLEDIAKENNVKIYKATELSESGKAKSMPQEFNKLLKSSDFIDAAFSYNINEISQIIEESDGFVLVRVDGIKDAHPKEIEQVRPEIEKIWSDNERSAIAQEIINDVTHDLENGDKIEEVAQRFKLTLNSTKPLKRSESFAGLTPAQMKDLFQEQQGTPKLFSFEDTQLIVVNTKIVDNEKKISPEEINTIKMKVLSDITQDTANQLVNAYGSNYKVRVKYKDAGIDDL